MCSIENLNNLRRLRLTFFNSPGLHENIKKNLSRDTSGFFVILTQDFKTEMKLGTPKLPRDFHGGLREIQEMC